MGHGHAAASGGSGDIILALPFLAALTLYGVGVAIQRHRACPWPWWRSLLWTAGVAAAASGFTGPFAHGAHEDFPVHMALHVVVGMAAPVMLVLASPMTLALRTLHVSRARRLSRLLTSAPARLLSRPVVAGVLSVGTLWLFYLTPLYAVAREVPLVHLAVMLHFLLAGCLFTAAIIPTDPAPHRAGYRHRLTVLVIAMALHSVLAKVMAASPPAGVAADVAEAGAILMYYAGDAVDVTILTILCARWYRHAGRRLSAPLGPGTSPTPRAWARAAGQ
jgi:putative membrane protein